MDLTPLRKTGHCILCKTKLKPYWKIEVSKDLVPTTPGVSYRAIGTGKQAWWEWRVASLVGYRGLGYFCSKRCGFLFGQAMAEGLTWAREMR